MPLQNNRFPVLFLLAPILPSLPEGRSSLALGNEDNGLYAVLQWGGQREHIQTAGTRPGVHHGQHLRPCVGGGRPAQRRHPLRDVLEEGLNVQSEWN